MLIPTIYTPQEYVEAVDWIHGQGRPVLPTVFFLDDEVPIGVQVHHHDKTEWYRRLGMVLIGWVHGDLPSCDLVIEGQASYIPDDETPDGQLAIMHLEETGLWTWTRKFHVAGNPPEFVSWKDPLHDNFLPDRETMETGRLINFLRHAVQERQKPDRTRIDTVPYLLGIEPIVDGVTVDIATAWIGGTE